MFRYNMVCQSPRIFGTKYVDMSRFGLNALVNIDLVGDTHGKHQSSSCVGFGMVFRKLDSIL